MHTHSGPSSDTSTAAAGAFIGIAAGASIGIAVGASVSVTFVVSFSLGVLVASVLCYISRRCKKSCKPSSHTESMYDEVGTNKKMKGDVTEMDTNTAYGSHIMEMDTNTTYGSPYI